MKILSRILVGLLVFLLCSVQFNSKVKAQKTVSQTIPALTFFKFFSEQPDHVSERVIKINSTEVRIKYAKKGDRIRQEFYPLNEDSLKVNERYKNYKIVTISQVNHQTFVLDPQEQTFSVASRDFNLISFDIDKIIQAAKSGINKVKVQKLESISLEGHKVRKYKMTFQNEQGGIYFYFDEDMKNLFVRMEADKMKELNGSYTLINASLEVSDEMFEVPKNYKEIEFNDLIMNIKQKAKN